MKIVFKFILVLFVFQFSLSATAQKVDKEQKEARELLQLARDQMAEQDFQAANRTFRQMLELKTTLPTEMCYFFANTLYMLGQHENSLRFVEKYEKLAGVGGEFYQDTQNLKALLNKERETILSCNFCDNQGYILHACQYCEGEGFYLQSCRKCFGNEHIKCISCEGEGVLIVKNHFGQSNYQTCGTCAGHGFQDCPYCEGTGQKKQNCQYCSGSGSLAGKEICQHPPEVN